jgi:amino-acid N-acetyltransferase
MTRMVRKAELEDARQIARLVNGQAESGLLLPRSLGNIYENLRDFWVAQEDGKIVACGALHIVWENLAEVRSAAVDPAYRGRGLGRAVVDAVLQEARELGIRRAFALTYQTGFFARFGFVETEKEQLPHKVWRDCITCPKFVECDEVAMLLDLTPVEATQEGAQ